MTLPPRIARKPKRDTRWRSPAHCNFVRSHACAMCSETAGLEAAHVRLGSGAGMSQKPDDWRVVGLCRDCHTRQHRAGEATFWRDYQASHGQSVEDLIAAFVAASPKRREIEQVQRERANG